MRPFIRFGNLIALFLLPVLAGAQMKYYQRDASVIVNGYGSEKTLAWCGGFNNPQFAMADLNHDGLQDLVVFENGNSLRTFINTGTEGSPVYTYVPEYGLNFPPLLDFMVLADFNCDGIADLFEQDGVFISVYKGYYNASNQLCFTYYIDLFYTNDSETHGFPGNAFNNPGDIPSIVDVNNDGAVDIVSYDVDGQTMNYYKNLRVDLGLSCDTLAIELADRCWGKVRQYYPRTHQLQWECSEAGLCCDKVTRTTHIGNTPCLFDWDMDGDYDYLDGSISFNEMTFLENGRIPYNPTGPDSMFYQDTMWQSAPGGTQIEVPVWPAAFNVDVDQDGKKDLLISPNTPNLSENYRCIWYYKNESSPGIPNWQFQSDTFMIDKSIDLGTAAYPMLFDFNGDGLPDLFIGSDGYFQSDGTLRSRISYYLNTSVDGSPSFTIQTYDFLNIDSFGFRGAAPAFGDIDGDGLPDMILGHTDGSLSYFKNMAASSSVPPVWKLMELQLTDVAGDTINTGGYAAPFIYDIDKDGKKDLVIGGEYGYLTYYQNVSVTPGVISLKLISTHLGNARVDSNRNFGNYSAPFFGRIDSTGIDYLMAGSYSGDIYRYTGFQSGDTSATYTMLDSQFAFIDSTYSVYNHAPGTSLQRYDGLRSTPTVGHIGTDSSYYLIFGNNKGGVQLYKWELRNTTETPTVYEKGKALVYPNPTKDVLNVSWNDMLSPMLQISVMNMAGQTLYITTTPSAPMHTAIPTSMLPSGMYVCQIQSGVNRYYSKFTVIR